MKKGGGSESTIIVGPSKSVLVYALHSLEYVLGLARFRVLVPNLLLELKLNLHFSSKHIIHIILQFKSLYKPYPYIHTYLAQTPEIGQGLGRFLSCEVRKPEQT